LGVGVAVKSLLIAFSVGKVGETKVTTDAVSDKRLFAILTYSSFISELFI